MLMYLQRFFLIGDGNSGGVVVKLQEVRGSIPGLAATISEIGYLLLPSRDMAETSLFKAT